MMVWKLIITKMDNQCVEDYKEDPTLFCEEQAKLKELEYCKSIRVDPNVRDIADKIDGLQEIYLRVLKAEL